MDSSHRHFSFTSSSEYVSTPGVSKAGADKFLEKKSFSSAATKQSSQIRRRVSSALGICGFVGRVDGPITKGLVVQIPLPPCPSSCTWARCLTPNCSDEGASKCYISAVQLPSPSLAWGIRKFMFSLFCSFLLGVFRYCVKVMLERQLFLWV